MNADFQRWSNNLRDSTQRSLDQIRDVSDRTHRAMNERNTPTPNDNNSTPNVTQDTAERTKAAPSSASCPEALLSGVWTSISSSKNEPGDFFYRTLKFFSNGSFLNYFRHYDPSELNDNYTLNGVYNDVIQTDDWSCINKTSVKFGGGVAQISTSGDQITFKSGLIFRKYDSIQIPFGRAVTKSDFPY